MSHHGRFGCRTLWVLTAVAGVVVTGNVAADGASTVGGGPDGTVTLVSVRSDEQPAAGQSRLAGARPVVSSAGRFVVFQSNDPKMTADVDNDDVEDVFVRDRVLETTTLVSGTHGQAVGGSGGTISGDGRYVAFLSASSALTKRDSNGPRFDVFVRDMKTGDVTLVSKASDGTQRNVDTQETVISGNGRRVAFLTPARLSQADDDKAPADEPLRRFDVYVHNLASGNTRLASVNRHGSNFTAPVGLGGISHDGRSVGFTWGYIGKDKRDVPGGFYVRSLAMHGSTLIWRQDINALTREIGAGLALSGDGRFAAFTSKSDRIDPEPGYRKADVVRVNIRTGHRSVVSVGAQDADANGDSDSPTLSARGRFVAFSSEADNLTTGDDNQVADAYRFDCRTERMALVSSRPDGRAGNSSSTAGGGVSISADGKHVAFDSFATDLAPGDGPDGDVFLWKAIN